MSSPRVLEACQEESISRAQWLEEELVGPSLGVLVGELMVLAGPAAAAERQFTAEQAAEWLGRDLRPTLSAGLATLPKDKLDELFRRPAILGGLQELVLVEGGEHWDGLVGRSDVFKATAAFHRRELAQRLGFADQADPPSTTGRIPLPAADTARTQSRWLPAAIFTLSGLAAAVLAAVILPRLTRDPASPTVGAADQPGQLATTAPQPDGEPPASPAPPSPAPPPEASPPTPVVSVPAPAPTSPAPPPESSPPTAVVSVPAPAPASPAPPPESSPPTAIVSVQTPEPRNPAPPPAMRVVPVPAPAPVPPSVVVDPAGPPQGDRSLHAAVVVPHHPLVALLAGPRPEPISEELLAQLAAESRDWSRTVAAAEQVSPSDLALAVEEAQRAAQELDRVVSGQRGRHMPQSQREALRRACGQANDTFRRIDDAIRGPARQRGNLDDQRRELLEALDALERALAPPARDPV